MGLFWRNVILERVMITRSYEPKVHLCGRGGEIFHQTYTRRYPPTRVVILSCNNIELYYVFGRLPEPSIHKVRPLTSHSETIISYFPSRSYSLYISYVNLMYKELGDFFRKIWKKVHVSIT